MDIGLALARAMLAGRGSVVDHLPPWYAQEPVVDEGGLVAALNRFAEKSARGE